MIHFDSFIILENFIFQQTTKKIKQGMENNSLTFLQKKISVSIDLTLQIPLNKHLKNFYHPKVCGKNKLKSPLDEKIKQIIEEGQVAANEDFKMCTNVLINDRFALTSAACVEP